MPQKTLPSKVIIIGAGASGLFAARQLEILAKQMDQEIEIVILERENHVGGKCYTYADVNIPDLKTEWGAALVAPNYGPVLDGMKEHNLKFEKVVPTNRKTLEISEILHHLPYQEKIAAEIALGSEVKTFVRDYETYKDAVQNEKNLPQELKRPFYEYAQQRGMKYLPKLLKPFVPGFGYGALSRCSAYSVLEYMGKTTLIDIMLAESVLGQPSLLSIQGGFQLLMEKIAASLDVRLQAEITQIKREDNKVTVTYENNGSTFMEEGDALILATSPLHWPKLGMDLTELEQECVNSLEYYQYPVAVCKIKGLPPQQHFFPNALEEEQFGRIALITTRDNRDEPEGGRLCSIYVNLPPGNQEFKFDYEQIKKDILTIEGVTDIEFLEEKIWPDYMSTLPWELRLQLNEAQQAKDNKTYFAGSYILGGFEDVASVAGRAVNLVNKTWGQKTYEEDFSMKNVNRAWGFFTRPVYPPVDSKGSQHTPEPRSCCVIV
ncbi:FAD-dependent oxidoreductase [Legionella spiritensis]|uniref:FAD-dependent oxidoreductase n=1 Tax=Legionella spiritensis TaxID=452 RepID=UPI000F71EFD9|nr:FAD-dependent oxidoreductase [Legionella spiritensis]VEG92334.1 protoporphyrinogen oxidase [Legionella spiritensis]